MTGAVVGAALLTNMILLNSVRASDRGWQHLIGERDWEEKMAMLKEDRIERDKKLQQKFSTAVNNLDGKIEDLKGGLNKKKCGLFSLQRALHWFSEVRLTRQRF